MAVNVREVNARIAVGLGDRMVTIHDLPATVIEFREGEWHIASIITERNLTRRMEPHELVVFDVGSNVKEVLDQLQAPGFQPEVHLRRRQRADAVVSQLEEAAENIRFGKSQFAEAERLARAALDELVLLAGGG